MGQVLATTTRPTIVGAERHRAKTGAFFRRCSGAVDDAARLGRCPHKGNALAPPMRPGSRP